jgi:phospholipid/cholesterol/gamma-HCH transport system substrate-binding protein
METRAPYALIGLFVLAAIGAVFGFVYWMQNTGGLGERAIYRVRFEHSVAGILAGSAVTFNGIRVGEVTDLRVLPENPQQVMATISVSPATPVRSDTQASLDIQGLTGIAVVALNGGSPASPPLKSSDGQPPLLVADPMAWQSMTQAARSALQRVDSVLADNSQPLKETIANLRTFSDALARNSARIDTIAAGLDRMVGGAGQPQKTFYDLNAPRQFPPIDKPSKAQIAIPEPSSVLMFDTQKILVQPPGIDDPSFAGAVWSDNLPKMVQQKIIQSFDESHYIGAVTRPMDALTPDYQLLIDIRNFQIVLSPEKAAEVEFAAKIADTKGRIIATRTFRATVPADVKDAASAAAALDRAFGQTATELVTWTAKAI